MPRYKLQTLLIVLEIGPPVLAIGYTAWQEPELFLGVVLLAALTLFMWGHFYLAIHSDSSREPLD